MFLGIKLLFLLLISPLIIAIFIYGYQNRRELKGRIVLWGFSVVSILFFLLILAGALFKKMELTKDDYYGQYIIDRDYFKGTQADWQYNSFRFEITENDSIFFHITEDENITHTYKGTVSTITPYSSARLIVHMDSPRHHILTSNPTIYREAWGFFLVFNSPKFNNMYFRQGCWKKINK